MGVKPGECWFCRDGRTGVPRGPLCDTCRGKLHDFRLWLRERYSTLTPLEEP